VRRSEHQKFDPNDLEKVVKDFEDGEEKCRKNCNAYIEHLEDNVTMHRKK
jgi:hypothetical protein